MCLSIIWSCKVIPIAWNNQAREHYKKAYFMWLYNLTPTWFIANFCWHICGPWLWMMCNHIVTDIHLHRYKQNCFITSVLSESWLVLCGVFLFFVGYVNNLTNWQPFTCKLDNITTCCIPLKTRNLKPGTLSNSEDPDEIQCTALCGLDRKNNIEHEQIP